jgi:hypothetical protein
MLKLMEIKTAAFLKNTISAIRRAKSYRTSLNKNVILHVLLLGVDSINATFA